MVPPAGIEPASAPSYHRDFRRRYKRRLWSGLYLDPGRETVGRVRQVSTHSRQWHRASLGIASLVPAGGSPTLNAFTSSLSDLCAQKFRRGLLYPFNYGDLGEY